MICRRAFLALVTLVLSVSDLQADEIDFSTLNSSDVSDVDGQNFAWSFGSQSGVVNVRATWSTVLAVDGAMRTPVRAPASFEAPFTGTVAFTFDSPVEVSFMATFASLVNGEDSSGRFFEEVRLSSPAFVQLYPAPGTTAAYAGAGTNSILAADAFNMPPNLSIWGFIGAGQSTTYELQYRGTRSGLSETFNVNVIPEPTGFMLMACALAGISCIAWRRRLVT